MCISDLPVSERLGLLQKAYEQRWATWLRLDRAFSAHLITRGELAEMLRVADWRYSRARQELGFRDRAVQQPGPRP
jgi:hypothetical protein